MPPEKTITMTQEELDLRMQAAVEKEKLAILIDDFKDRKAEEEARYISIDKNTAALFELVRSFPEKVTQCRDDLENDIHKELEKNYVTGPAVELIVHDFNNKIDRITSRFKWTTGIIVSIAGVIQFVTTMWYMGLQISKITGGP